MTNRYSLWGHYLQNEVSYQLCPPKHNLYPRIKAAHDYYAECACTGAPFDPDMDYTAMTQVDLCTYRTPDYMLSCAQDYRKGKWGFQQHIWQATLAGQAVVFTSQPGAPDVGKSRPDYWHGNGYMPRAAAYRNVLLCLHRFDADQSALPYSHAYFPRWAMDEWMERGGWAFGRKGEGYVALRCLSGARWAEPRAEDLEQMRPVDAPVDWQPGPYELVAEGGEAAWICELGNAAAWGSFAAFVEAVSSAAASGDTSGLTYESPSVGRVSFGWDEPLMVGGRAVALRDYARMENAYGRVEFDARRYELAIGEERLVLDWDSGQAS